MTAEAGDRIHVETGDETVDGLMMPSSSDETIVLKLDGGYNYGIDRSRVTTVEVVEKAAAAVETSASSDGKTEAAGTDTTVSLVSTGGTIASRVDYRTGAVTPEFSADDILSVIPELEGRANYRGRVVANRLSENMTPDVWEDLAAAIVEEIEAGADGIVVMHGTDTMQHTAAAISFMVDTPVPIVFTGSQRSADRPSSDNVMNAVCAVKAAKADHSEVLICMHATSSDDRCALHRGVRARKNHTSRRDAFETIGRQPLGYITYPSEEVNWRRNPTPRTENAPHGVSTLNHDVGHIKFSPGDQPEHYRALINAADYDGVVFEGTGLGHINTDFIDLIDALTDDGIPVVMTSQCLEGRVCDRVYGAGRDLLDAGVVEAENTLPNVAKVKLMWALAHEENPEETMGVDVAGEITDSSRPWG